MSAFLVAAALVGLILGSELAVRAAKRLAVMLGVSPLVIGLTIASIGTSLPEIATNLSAAFNAGGELDTSPIAVGNIIGSNLSQISLLLGITALVGPLAVARHNLWRDGVALFAAMGMMFATAVDGETSQSEGALLIVAYVLYLALVWNAGRSEARADTAAEPVEGSIWFQLAVMAVGLAIVVFSADLAIRAAVDIARGFGVSETAIGIGIGFGTGLPELAVAVRAVRAGSGAFALGNLIGSNVTDPLLSYGAGATVHAVQVPANVLEFDFPVWLAATALAVFLLRRGARLGRLDGVLLVAVFVAYVAARALVLPG